MLEHRILIGRAASPGRADERSLRSFAAGKLARPKPRKAKPIDLYYWPTPNGWKVSIMLEECGLPYNVIPVNIARGDQFKPAFLKISPNNRMPAIVDPDGPGGRPISIFESGAILQYLGRKTGKFYPASERAPRRGGRVAVLADGQSRSQGRGGEPLPPLCAGEGAVCDRALRQRDEPALRRHEHAAEGSADSLPAAIPSRTWPASAGSGWSSAKGNDARRLSAPQALARRGAGAAGGAARHAHPRRGGGPGGRARIPKVRAVLFGQRAR